MSKLKLVITLLLVIPFVLSSLNINAIAATKLELGQKKQSIYIGVENVNQSIAEIRNSDNSALDSVKNYFREDKLSVIPITESTEDKPDMEDIDSLAYPYKEVVDNESLKSYLQTALNNGKKVYLFGDLTFDEYSKVLDVDIEMEVPTNDDEYVTVTLGEVDSELYETKEKNVMLDKTEQKVSVKFDNKMQIIGYSLNTNEPLRVFGENINDSNQDGELDGISSSLFIQEILRHEARNIEMYEEINSIGPLASVRVKSSNGDLRSTAGYMSGTAGELISQWYLNKENSENDANWDYFYLEVHSRINAFSSTCCGTWAAKNFTSTHSLYYTEDELSESTPDTSADGTYLVTLGYPWNVGFSYSNSAKPKYNLYENWPSDYSRWTITPPLFGSLAGSQKYQLYTAWRSDVSKYKKTGITVTNAVRFETGIDVATIANQSFTVLYSY